MKNSAKTKIILTFLLVIMAGLIVFAVFFKDTFISLLTQPKLYRHTLFLHIVSVSLFFANAVIGMIWESRSIASGSREIILHTYKTVTLLDSVFSSPLIILSLLSGLSLSFSIGELWQIGWLSLSFLLFILSGVIWIATDIPTQYKVKRLMSQLAEEDKDIPAELTHLLKLRWRIGLLGVLPLAVVFMLMIYKPDITAVAYWF